MKRLLLLACALAPLTGTVARATEPTTASAQTEERVRCRYVRTTGSRIPERICRTEAQWAEIERQSREALERNQRGAGASGDGSRR